MMAPLGPFAGDRRMAVAVSGGADSMALALLLRGWGQPFACVVDHGLRQESASEAGLTMRRLAVLGIPARLLRAGLSHGPGLAERARAARYALLGAACRDAGLADLALGHHLRDQAETLLLRRAAGSGLAGLSGMAAVAHTDAMRLIRPLLAVPPVRLRATLQAQGIEWVEDPSNTDPATPRALLRAGLLSDPAEPPRLGAEAREHGAARAAAEAQAAAELAASALIHPCGVAHLRGPVGPYALSALVWTLSGAAYPPPTAGLQRLSGCLHADAAHDGTLHGARIMPAGRLGPGWLVGREASAMEGAVGLGQRWDGRFQAAPDGAGPGMSSPGLSSPDLSLGPLGPDAARVRRRSALPSALLQTLPTLRRNGGLVAVPHLCYPDAAACRSAIVWFRPARPVVPAAFVTV
jgi:tRNA(Ile)-lysidine synthase